jgi:hypothetical protein
MGSWQRRGAFWVDYVFCGTHGSGQQAELTDSEMHISCSGTGRLPLFVPLPTISRFAKLYKIGARTRNAFFVDFSCARYRERRTHAAALGLGCLWRVTPRSDPENRKNGPPLRSRPYNYTNLHDFQVLTLISYAFQMHLQLQSDFFKCLP